MNTQKQDGKGVKERKRSLCYDGIYLCFPYNNPLSRTPSPGCAFVPLLRLAHPIRAMLIPSAAVAASYPDSASAAAMLIPHATASAIAPDRQSPQGGGMCAWGG